MKIIVSLFMISLLSCATNAEEWRGIKPLYSTRQDVESLIGKPIEFSTYVIGNEVARITYSNGFCASSKDWNVPKDTVLSISVRRRSGFLLFSDLKLDKTKFKIKEIFQKDIVEYWNEEDGIFYEVTYGEYIHVVNYIPSSKDKRFLCPYSKIKVDELRNRIKPLISSRAEVERLLGLPLKANNFYILKNETVTFNYSDGVCKSTVDWNVQKDRVISYEIHPTEIILFSDLKLDQTKFKVFESQKIIYVNEDEGVSYEIGNIHGVAIVESISIYPSEKDNDLRCKNREN
jgi:hypothetical protein